MIEQPLKQNSGREWAGPAGATDLSAVISSLRSGARETRDRHRRALKLALVVGDALSLTVAVTAAYWLRFAVPLPVFYVEAAARPEFYRWVGVGIVLLWLQLFALGGLYRIENLLGGTREYALVFRAVSVGLIVITFTTFLDPGFVIARAWLLLSWAFALLLVIGLRFWMRRLVYGLRRRGYFLVPALVVGTNEEARALAVQLGNSRYSGLSILGFVAARDRAGQDPRVHRNLFALGDLGDLRQLVDHFDVEELIVATSGIPREDLVEIFREYSVLPGLKLRLSGGLFEIMTTGLEVKQLASVSLLEVTPVRLQGFDVLLKVLLDLCIALTVVVLGAPLFLLLALLVKLDSPGPVLHRRRVLGLGGKEFDAFKFRSMRVDGDAILVRHPELQAELERDQKLKDDPRVTRVGAWLRKTSLDELPQAFNVLRGEMSIVGPRMISPEEHERYGQWDMNLLTVRPGITGLWQVSGRSDLSYEERVRLDMNYIRNWTIWLDLQILMQTIPAVLARRGAY